MTEVIRTLIEESDNINLKTELISALDVNEDLLRQFKIKPEFKLATTKTLYGIQLKEYCIINICSFLDEYDTFFSINYVETLYKTRVIKIKKFLKPFIKEIKRDYNLKDYRNHILAHNLRDNSKSLLMGDVVKTYNFPKYTEEFNSINTIINMIVHIVVQEFENDLPQDYWHDKVISSNKIVMDRKIKVFDLHNLEELRRSFIKE
ncbi:hypothetical protein MKS83_19980 [Chryseobacterium sp. Y16C]|uniref:hypothetical protein n=1 Tax=Chryseobacterium sp. Y16C TaxID=2920939 RepID=UPI001F0A408E|nr:hypothetical protein [Chryseobacterium sp. Y16C]UMQ41651.1 hypothetical protein MKS83_19980 [Chryseobacterium sp. Y16C]